MITVQRHNPHTHEGVFLVCHTAFYAASSHSHSAPRTLDLPEADLDAVLLSASLQVSACLS